MVPCTKAIHTKDTNLFVPSSPPSLHFLPPLYIKVVLDLIEKKPIGLLVLLDVSYIINRL